LNIITTFVVQKLLYNMDGKQIAVWLRDADLLNKSALCGKIGMDRGNFNRYLASGEIPEKYVPLILDTINSNFTLISKKAVSVQDLTKPNKVIEPKLPHNTELEKLEADLAAIPDRTKGLGKKLAEKLQHKIETLKTK
jgi:hypothetical protein